MHLSSVRVVPSYAVKFSNAHSSLSRTYIHIWCSLFGPGLSAHFPLGKVAKACFTFYNDNNSNPNPYTNRPSRLNQENLCLNGSWIDKNHSLLLWKLDLLSLPTYWINDQWEKEMSGEVVLEKKCQGMFGRVMSGGMSGYQFAYMHTVRYTSLHLSSVRVLPSYRNRNRNRYFYSAHKS